MPRGLNCWGCGGNKCFATVSAMLIHVESGTCSADWNTRYVNSLAIRAPYARDFFVRGESHGSVLGHHALLSW